MVQPPDGIWAEAVAEKPSESSCLHSASPRNSLSRVLCVFLAVSSTPDSLDNDHVCHTGLSCSRSKPVSASESSAEPYLDAGSGPFTSSGQPFPTHNERMLCISRH